eukprot:SAG11_NODE_68_length_18649_cov_29.058005_4_plen_470_part_00
MSSTCIGDSEALATQLIGLPHALILENLNNELRFLVPNIDLVRPRIKIEPFTTKLVLNRESRKWLAIKRKYFVYDLHISRTFLCCEKASEALYLCFARLLARSYEATVPLLPSVRTDVPFSPTEVHFLNQIMEIEDTHPNAISVIYSIYNIAAQNGYELEEPKVPMREEQHVSALCRPTDVLSLSEVSMDVQDQESTFDCPRASMIGGQKDGIYGYFSYAKKRVMDQDLRYVRLNFNCLNYDEPDKYLDTWTKAPVEQMAAVEEMVTAEEKGLVFGYCMLVSGLRTAEGAGKADILRLTRMLIAQWHTRNGDSALMLALLTTVWQIESGANRGKRWPMWSDGRHGVARNTIYVWKLGDSQVSGWSQAGFEWLSALVNAAQNAIKEDATWANKPSSARGTMSPHVHQAFAPPDYLALPRGMPAANNMARRELTVAPAFVCDARASLELSPRDVEAMASPEHGGALQPRNI